MPPKKVFDFVLYILLLSTTFFLSAALSSQIILKGEIVTLPDLVGKTLDEAKTELARKKLSIALRGIQPDDNWQRGKIIFQEPSAGSKIKVNKVVKVVLSGGSEKILVPRLTGRSLEVSSQILKDAGLLRGKISQVHTPQYAAGKVIAQQPLPSEEVERNSPVGLLVSQGEWEEKYLMPDLIGKQARAVMAKIKEMEFKIADVRYSYYPGLEPGIIIKQFPPPGYRIQKRNLITLEVSKE